MALTGKALEEWKKKNFNTNITVDQSQIDALNSRKTPQGNFDYYSKNGANEMEVESLNRFYGKDKVAAAGIGVKPKGNDPDRPNTREDRLVPDRDRPNAREDRPTPTPTPTPGFRNQYPPFGPSTPRPIGPPQGNTPGFREKMPNPLRPPVVPPDRGQNPDRVIPPNPGFRGSMPNPLRPPATPGTQPPRANIRENRSSTIST